MNENINPANRTTTYTLAGYGEITYQSNNFYRHYDRKVVALRAEVLERTAGSQLGRTFFNKLGKCDLAAILAEFDG